MGMANAKREVAGYAVQRSAQRIGEEGVNRVTAATEIMSTERVQEPDISGRGRRDIRFVREGFRLFT